MLIRGTTCQALRPEPLLHKPIRSHVTNQSHRIPSHPIASHRIPSHPIASHRTQHSSIHSLISSHMQTHSFLFFILTTHQLREIHNNIQFNHNQFLRNSSSNEDRLIIHLHVFSHTTYDMLRSVTRHTTCCVQSRDTRHVAFKSRTTCTQQHAPIIHMYASRYYFFHSFNIPSERNLTIYSLHSAEEWPSL